jgi:predicted DCC family thiol-disulfide oxidoreductase YuxK
VRTIFGIDLRTLALFRVALAAMVIADLVSRARDLTAHYTDAGILPRAALLGPLGQWQPSLHLMSGSATFQGVLFLIAGIAALALLVGYRTRAATILSWLLLISLQARNIPISQGGDVLLAMLLFWSMFLPLGARWSVDAALQTRPERGSGDGYFSIATMALLLQCMSVYFFSAQLKAGSAWMPDGTAVYYALQIDYLATPFAVWLRQFPDLLTLLTYYVWWLELLGPLLIFSPILFLPLRLALMAMFISMHIGFLLCLEIGVFPLISITSLLAFTPGWVWDQLATRLRTPERAGLSIYYDGPCTFCRKVALILRTFLLPRSTPVRPAQDYPDIHSELLAHNSWVVVDHDRSHHVRWDAVALVFRRSAVFWPLGKLFSSAAMRGVGERIYEAVARNRPLLGRMSAAALPYRDDDPALPPFAGFVVAGLMLFVLVGNLRTVGVDLRLPRSIEGIRTTLHLGQTWNMFAPEPTRWDGWWVVRGETASGRAVDVLQNELAKPDWTRPKYLTSTYPTYRWRKYLVRLAYARYAPYRPYFADYLCREWNAHSAPADRLVRIALYFNLEHTPADYGPRRTERTLLHVQDC